MTQASQTDLSSSSEPPSLWTDLQGAGSGARAAGQAAGALPGCEGHGHRASGAGPQVLPGGPLPDAADLGRERRPRRRTAALLFSARVAGWTAQNAPGECRRRNWDKLLVSVDCRQSATMSWGNQVLSSAWWWVLSLRCFPRHGQVSPLWSRRSSNGCFRPEEEFFIDFANKMKWTRHLILWRLTRHRSDNLHSLCVRRVGLAELGKAKLVALTLTLYRPWSRELFF